MIVAKFFEFSATHILKNTLNRKNSLSINGSTYKVEVMFEVELLKDCELISDINIFCPYIKNFINSFDGSYIACTKDGQDNLRWIRMNSERWVYVPVTPTIDQLSLMILNFVDKVISNITFKNNQFIKVHSVKITKGGVGYTQVFREDLKLINYTLDKISFSPGVIIEWSNKNMIKDILNNKPFELPKFDYL